MSRLIKIGIAVLVCYGVLVAIIWLIKYQSMTQVPLKEDYIFPTFDLKMPDGVNVKAVYRKSLVRKKDAPLLIFFRGTRSNLQYYTNELDLLESESGFDVLTFDYRSAGRSQGKRLEERHLLDDADQLYKYATETLGYKPESIVVYGYSMGSVPATWLASKYPVAYCIIHQGFAHFAMEFEPLVRPWYRNTILSPIKHLSNTEKHLTPLVVIHGIQDFVTPSYQAQSIVKLAEKQNRPLTVLWLKNGHLTLFEDARVLHLLRRISEVIPHVPT